MSQVFGRQIRRLHKQFRATSRFTDGEKMKIFGMVPAVKSNGFFSPRTKSPKFLGHPGPMQERLTDVIP